MTQGKTPGKCRAMRCTDDATETAADGVELCAEHGPQYTPEESAPAADAPDDLTEALEAAKEETQGLDDYAVESQEDCDNTGEVLTYLAGRSKEFDARRKDEVQDLNRKVKAINGRYNPLVRTYAEAADKIKAALVQAIQEGHDLQREAQEAVAAGEDDPEVVAAARGEHLFQLPASLSLVQKPAWEVEDEEAIPVDYWRAVLDDEKIETDLAADEQTQIPGIKRTIKYVVKVMGQYGE